MKVISRAIFIYEILLPKANVSHQRKLKREEKKVSNDAKRHLTVLTAAVTTFFRPATDHQNKDQVPIKTIRPSNTKQPAKTRSSRRTVGLCIS
jgi:hypothetical protein